MSSPQQHVCPHHRAAGHRSAPRPESCRPTGMDRCPQLGVTRHHTPGSERVPPRQRERRRGDPGPERSPLPIQALGPTRMNRVGSPIPNAFQSRPSRQRDPGRSRPDRQRPALMVDRVDPSLTGRLAKSHRALTSRAIVLAGRLLRPDPIPIHRCSRAAQIVAVIGRSRLIPNVRSRPTSEVVGATPPAAVYGNRRRLPYRACRAGWRCSPTA